jgi:hypothetical protein
MNFIFELWNSPSLLARIKNGDVWSSKTDLLLENWGCCLVTVGSSASSLLLPAYQTANKLQAVVREHTIETYRVSTSTAPLTVKLGTRWRRAVTFTPRPLYYRWKKAGTLWIGDRVDPRAGADVLGKWKNYCPWRGVKRHIIQPIA